MKKDNNKIINAWAMYDWANSVYPLVITSTIFPIYYQSVTTTISKTGGVNDKVHFLGFDFINTTLYTFSLAFAYLLVAIIIPLLSGVADYSGSKKRFMQFFCYLGALSCSAMYFFTGLDNLWLGVLLVILSCVGFSGSIVFYNAFLPEIATPKHHDRVSAKGFAMGYIGSAILLILNLMMVLKPQWFDIENAKNATRFAFITVGAWWILFAQIPFYYLPNNIYGKKPKRNFVYFSRRYRRFSLMNIISLRVSASSAGDFIFKGYNELLKVWKELKQHQQLAQFLTAFFVYNMGVQTVMLVATLFGSKELKLESAQLIIVILLIQFVAIAGAYLFSFISGKKGNIFTLKSAVIIWIAVCIAAYFVHTAIHFYILAGIVGLVMGGIQSLSRSTYSKMLPDTENHASYFSFFDVTEKICIVCGMGLFGIIEQISNNMRYSIIALISFFIIGFILLLRIKTERR